MTVVDDGAKAISRTIPVPVYLQAAALLATLVGAYTLVHTSIAVNESAIEDNAQRIEHLRDDINRRMGEQQRARDLVATTLQRELDEMHRDIRDITDMLRRLESRERDRAVPHEK